MNAPSAGKLDPSAFNTPAGQIFDASHIDNLARAILSLTREVAVLNDRVMVLETLLEEQGVVTSEAVDTYQPDEAFQKRADAAVAEITRGVIASLQGTDKD
ncbi:MAG: hypothetical protein AAF494_08785 [Pseudomonadota bacterium]